MAPFPPRDDAVNNLNVFKLWHQADRCQAHAGALALASLPRLMTCLVST